MQSWINSQGQLTIHAHVASTSTPSQIAVNIPNGGYTLVRCIIVQSSNTTSSPTNISIGDNSPTYDNLVPDQNATPTVGLNAENTIVIEQSFATADIIYINSAKFYNDFNFSFILEKY